jgi:hypothetical protein
MIWLMIWFGGLAIYNFATHARIATDHHNLVEMTASMKIAKITFFHE